MKRGEPHRGRSFEYEKLAVEYSHRAFQLLTYLNGGALVAIPTALAFFRADVARSDVLLTAGAFVAGLVLVLLAQGCALFTMAKRAEASMFSYHEQFNRAVALQNPSHSQAYADRMSASRNDSAMGSTRLARSNKSLTSALILVSLSLVAFLIGCGWGAWVVLLAKEVAAK